MNKLAFLIPLALAACAPSGRPASTGSTGSAATPTASHATTDACDHLPPNTRCQ